MIRKSKTHSKTLALIALALASQACSPLTQGNGGLSSCAGSYLLDTAGDQVGLGQQGAKIGIGIAVTTTQLAQSFVAQSAAPIGQLSLKLDAVLPVVGTVLTGTITAEIVPDMISTIINPTPTTPSQVDVTTGVIQANGSIPASTVLTGSAQFYAFTFAGGSIPGTTSSPTPAEGVVLTPGQIYWIVVTSVFGSSATNYIEWRASNSAPANTISKYLSITTWTAIGNNTTFDYQLGC